jgi:hypothetical protein
MDAVAPAFDFTRAYFLPNDCLAIREFNGKLAGTSVADWAIENGRILTCDGCAKLRYTWRNETVGQWDATFIDAFTHALAAAVASGLSTAPGLSQNMRQRAEQIAIQATGPNARETGPRVIKAENDSGWLRARGSWIGHRSNVTNPTPAQWPNPL